jgi:MYXO-CTERM domain-containing protein
MFEAVNAAMGAGNRRLAGVAIAFAAALAAGRVYANGAFPDSETILVPADRPNEILVATNFGIVLSEDGGGTWTWACERPETTFGRLYQIGPGPLHRLYTVANGKLAYSDDGACGWQTARGAIAGLSVQDAFVDPMNGNRVFAVALAHADAGAIYSVLESSDGGTTFDTVTYTGVAGELVLGIECARSDPMTVYLTSRSAAGAPALARSQDGGSHWQTTDLSAALSGPGQLEIIAVDPDDARRVWLRWIGFSGDALLVTTDGGATVAIPLALPSGIITSFVRTAAGHLVLGGALNGAPVIYRSDGVVNADGGAPTFAPLPDPLPLRAMAQRDGIIYAATDNQTTHFGAATSRDEGATWQPELFYDRITAVVPCLKQACQVDCMMRAGTGQWPPAMCSADPGPPGGEPDAGANTDAAAPPRPPSGCACALPTADRIGAPLSLVMLAALWSARRRRH